MRKLSFSGHESFTCKQFWLKKGFDFAKSGKNFNDNSAVIDLGVGKNMVRSIRFWLSAFDITEKSSTTPSRIGEYLFGENGADPFLEDIGSIWLLHYHLIKAQRSSIYSLVFNEFRATRNEFSFKQLQDFIKQKCSTVKGSSYNANTVERDIRVFINNYLPSRSKKSQLEDTYSGLLHEIDLLNKTKKEDAATKENIDFYSVQIDEKDNLPVEIFAYAILDNPNFSTSISFRDLLIADNAPAKVFALNSDGLLKKIEALIDLYPSITYSETAGNRQLQISEKLDKWKMLDGYYKR